MLSSRRADLSRGKELALSRQLESVEAQLSPTSPAGLQRRLDALAAACRLRASSSIGVGHHDSSSMKLDDNSLQQLFAVLRDHVEGVKQLQEVLRRCERYATATGVLQQACSTQLYWYAGWWSAQDICLNQLLLRPHNSKACHLPTPF